MTKTPRPPAPPDPPTDDGEHTVVRRSGKPADQAAPPDPTPVGTSPFDQTVVRSAPVTPVPTPIPPAPDATVVVPRGPSPPADAIEVVPRTPAPPADATVVLPRAAPPPADATVVAPRATPPPFEATSAASPAAASPGPAARDPTGSTSDTWQRLSTAESPSLRIGPGWRLKDRFVLEREIGRGGMGVVYLALDERKVEARDRNPRVAIKVLNDEFRRHPDSLIALQRESRKAQHLAHDNIVRVYDFDKDGTVVFMTMEYVDGSDLRALIKGLDGRGLPLEEAFPLIEGMALALGRAHREGIVHSDFKPGNVMLTSARMPKVFDFGIARASKRGGEAGGEQTVFDAGSLGAMTPAYASLEMLKGVEPQAADDVYALSCVTYELLAGRHPFDKLNAEQAQQKGMVPVRIPGLSHLQWKTLAKGLAFERKDRLQRAEDLIAGLRPRTARERFLPAGLGTVGGLVVLGLLAWLGTVLYERHTVQAVDDCITSGACADAAQVSERLLTLPPADEARLREARLDTIRGVFLRSLAQAWNPEQRRYDYARARAVVALAFGLYGPDSVWVKDLGDNLEASRNRELSRLNDAFSHYISSGIYADTQDEGRGLLSVLDSVRAIDPQQALLRDGLLAQAFDRGIRQGLADPALPPKAQLDLAQKRLAAARPYLPDPGALRTLEADLRMRGAALDAAAAEESRRSTEVAQRGQQLAALETALAAAAPTAEWRSRVRGAWASARQDADAADPRLVQLGQRLAGILLAQGATPTGSGTLDAALEPVRLGLELFPDDAELARQFGVLNAARERQATASATGTDRAQLQGSRLDDLLARPLPAASWFGEVGAALKALAGAAPPAGDSAARRDRLDKAVESMVDEALAAADFGKADRVAKLGAGLDAADPRLAALPAKAAEGRKQAQSRRLARFTAVDSPEAFTPEWELALAAALAKLDVRDPALAGPLQTIAHAYAGRVDHLAADKSFDAARQAADTAAALFPRSTEVQAARGRLDDLEKADAADQDKQQVVMKVKELERTVQLKAAAAEIVDAAGALDKLRKLDPANAYAHDQGPRDIADGALKLAERLAAGQDYNGALRAADRGLAVMRTPELESARAGYEKSGCTGDLDRELKTRGSVPDARRTQCLAVLKGDAPTYAKYRSLEGSSSTAAASVGSSSTAVGSVGSSSSTAAASVAKAPDDAARSTDPCNDKLAGRGAEVQCADPIGESGKGPLMVVVVGKEPFAIGRFEVTNGDFARYCKAKGCTPPEGESGMPVTGITPDAARAYAGWLSEASGKHYRLPSEAEWSYAATAGGTAPPPAGNCRPAGAAPAATGGVRYAANGSASKWGLVNAVGNAWEMTEASGQVTLRGGSFQDSGADCSADARRPYAGPDRAVGFRLLREVDR